MRIVTTKLNNPLLFEEFKKTEVYKTFNVKQKKFFDHLFNGENMLLTGPAGTGKSYCIKALFDFVSSKNIFVGKAALTGVAALNIGGVTIHSWAGLGLADEDIPSIVKNARMKKKAVSRIQNTGILFIDEISMASADLLEKLDAVLKNIRFSPKPFGGMQMIFSGDFLQLPPVSKGYGKKLDFAFQSKAWAQANINTIELDKLIRQDENSEFAKLLQKIRFGDDNDLSLLATRVNAELNTEIDPIKIFCKNINVDEYNHKQYKKLDGQEQVYYAKDTGDLRYQQYFDRNCPAPTILKLKKGTQVMLLVNVDVEGGLVNGAIGVVDAFSPMGPIVKFSNGQRAIIDNNKWEIKEQELDLTGNMRYKIVANRIQVPLKLAWATSVHKQQGSTLDYAKIDLSEAFEFGQVYVALSRVKTLEGLSLTDFSPDRVRAHPECLQFYKDAKKKKVSLKKTSEITALI